MLVANSSFDLWQKDAFFSAAEEVQQSADIMESTYRLWLRQTKEQQSNSLRELQIALGTAKWQLDEFAKAVRFSCPRHENTTNRHNQFIEAMEDQISRVEKALVESLEQTFRWVHLDAEETTNLHLFLLSGTPATTTTSQTTNQGDDVVSSHHGEGAGEGGVFDKEFGTNTNNITTIPQEAKQVPTTRSAKITAELELAGSWKIEIADGPRYTQLEQRSVELASKSKPKPIIWRQNHHLQRRERLTFTKMFRRVGNVVRQIHTPNYNQITRSFPILLLLILFTFFLYKLFSVADA